MQMDDAIKKYMALWLCMIFCLITIVFINLFYLLMHNVISNSSGWEGMMKDKGIGNEKSSLCDQPICAEGLCGPYGTCVAPNNCACPKLYSRVSF